MRPHSSARSRTSFAALAATAVAAGLLVALSPAEPAHAWKPPTHLFGAEHALLDATVDGTITIPDPSGDPAKTISVAANPTIVEALQKFPEAYRAGVVGPDAYPDVYFGQSAIHPDTRFGNDTHPNYADGPDSVTDEWLAYMWEQAWRPDFTIFAYHLPVNDDHRLRNIAFATGFLAGHANGDVWAHTWLNQPDYADGAFPDLTSDADEGDVANFEDGDIAVRHVIIESYADKHRPGYNGVAPSTYQLDPPTDFIATTLLMSDFAQKHGQHRFLAPFIERYNTVTAILDELRFDREHQDCLDPAAADCTKKQHGDHVHSVCAVTSCVPHLVDGPVNPLEAIATAPYEAYFQAWREDLIAGIRAYVDVSHTIAVEMFVGKKAELAPVVDAMHDWVYKHMLSMLGYPDFVGNGALWVSDLLTSAYKHAFSCDGTVWTNAKNDRTFGDIFTASCDAWDDTKATIESWALGVADDLVSGYFTETLGLDRLPQPVFEALDLDSSGAIQPSEAVRIFREPEDYLGDTRIFPAGIRAKIDADMHLLPGVEDDAAETFRNYHPDLFAPLKNTQILAQLALLDQNGLNAYVKAKAGQVGDASGLADLYGVYVNYNQPQPSGIAPNNVMLGWITSLDGDHQFRRQSLWPDDIGSRHSYGSGRMWMFEDCVARDAVFRRTFRQPVSGHDAFADDFDPPTNVMDKVGPASIIELAAGSPGADHTAPSGVVYVTGDRLVDVRANDNFFPAKDVSLAHRHYLAASSPPAWTTTAGGSAALSLGSGPDGPYVVQARAADPCANSGSVTTRSYYLDNTPPSVAITSPAAGQYDTAASLPVVVSATDTGSGVASSATTLNGAAAPQVIETFVLGPGVHVLTITARDHLGHEASAAVSFRVRATAASLRTNVVNAGTSGTISDPAVLQGLLDKLDAAAQSHLKGKHAAEWKQLEAFVLQVEAQSGQGIDPALAALLIAYAKDIVAAGG